MSDHPDPLDPLALAIAWLLVLGCILALAIWVAVIARKVLGD